MRVSRTSVADGQAASRIETGPDEMFAHVTPDLSASACRADLIRPRLQQIARFPE